MIYYCYSTQYLQWMFFLFLISFFLFLLTILIYLLSVYHCILGFLTDVSESQVVSLSGLSEPVFGRFLHLSRIFVLFFLSLSPLFIKHTYTNIFLTWIFFLGLLWLGSDLFICIFLFQQLYLLLMNPFVMHGSGLSGLKRNMTTIFTAVFTLYLASFGMNFIFVMYQVILVLIVFTAFPTLMHAAR